MVFTPAFEIVRTSLSVFIVEIIKFRKCLCETTFTYVCKREISNKRMFHKIYFCVKLINLISIIYLYKNLIYLIIYSRLSHCSKLSNSLFFQTHTPPTSMSSSSSSHLEISPVRFKSPSEEEKSFNNELAPGADLFLFALLARIKSSGT